jgi:3-hydroxyacyl-CoA dehydrogenase/enoyl-CoA hydratase/3-hydroxybutyryl-CoA epimerase
MQLVEVVRGRYTDDDTVATLVDFARRLGKVPVVVKDSPGFLVNRILFPYLDEAVRLVLEGVPGKEVDQVAVRFGMPIGPLELLDQIGVDIAADVSKTFAALSSDVSPTLSHFTQMVADRAHGKKTGRGFYEYRGGQRGEPTRWAMPPKLRPPIRSIACHDPSDLEKRLLYSMINEAANCLESHVVGEAWVVDLAVVLGTGFAPFRGGPLRTADTLGLPFVVRELESLRRAYGVRFAPTSLLRQLADEGHIFHPEMPHPLIVA